MARQTSFRELQARLNELAERVEDASPLLPELDEDYRNAVRGQFDSGRGWRPLSPQYAAQKAREGKDRRIGVYSGNLMRSLTQAGHRQHVTRYTQDKSLIVGSTDQMQRLFTGKHRSRNQPRRQVRMPPALRRVWLSRTQDFLVGESW